MYVTYFILSNLKKKTCFLPSLLEKYLFRNRSLIYKFLRPLSLKVSVLFVVKCDFFLHFSSKRHQPMLWSLYTFKYTSACETFGKKKKKKIIDCTGQILSLNISKSIYLLLLCIKCATHAIIMQYQ